jgi:hypothetical protein
VRLEGWEIRRSLILPEMIDLTGWVVPDATAYRRRQNPEGMKDTQMTPLATRLRRARELGGLRDQRAHSPSPKKPPLKFKQWIATRSSQRPFSFFLLTPGDTVVRLADKCGAGVVREVPRMPPPLPARSCPQVMWGRCRCQRAPRKVPRRFHTPPPAEARAGQGQAASRTP